MGWGYKGVVLPKKKRGKCHWQMGLRQCHSWLASNFFFFLGTPHSMWDLSFLTRDWTRAPGSRSRVLTTRPLGSPWKHFWRARCIKKLFSAHIYFFFILIFNCSIVVLQCYVSFRCTAQWSSFYFQTGKHQHLSFPWFISIPQWSASPPALWCSYTYIFFFRFFFLIDYCKTLIRVPCVMQ